MRIQFSLADAEYDRLGCRFDHGEVCKPSTNIRQQRAIYIEQSID